MAGREADPHNIGFCLPEIRSLCRPRFKVQEETLSCEDLISFSASEFNSTFRGELLIESNPNAAGSEPNPKSAVKH